MAEARGDREGDRELLRGMLQGREEAFDAFFSRFFPPLYRFALARVDADANAAEEIVQATLSRAISRISTFRGEAALLTWLCTFCRHEISAHYRGRRGHRLEQLIEDAPEIRAALESLAAAEESPEGAARRKQLARMVQATLDQLPGHYGDALEWKYIEGTSVAEIGARMGIAPKAAESLLTRAREAFREGFASFGAARPSAG